MKFWKDNPEVPKLVDYPRLGGIAVHDHVDMLHKPTRSGRPFFFQTKRSMMNAFWWRWQKEIEAAKAYGTLIDPNPENDDKFRNIGMRCLSNYWDMMVDRPRPLEVEKRYSWMQTPLVRWVGVMDQTRPMSIERIESYRPELVSNGVLHSEYDPVVILDLKTEFQTYDPEETIENPTDKDWIRTQFELHEYFQPTFYTWLYRMRHGKWPIGFLWYHMRTNAVFFTYREEKDFQELFLAIEHFVDSHNALSFPKNVGRQCIKCDYCLPCHGNRPFLKSLPEKMESAPPAMLRYVESPVVLTDTQLRLKLKVGRRNKRETLPLLPRSTENLVLQQIPLLGEVPKNLI